MDLHNGEFCVDVSEWGAIEYTEEEREKCDSVFEKVCEDKTERVSMMLCYAIYLYLSIK